MNHFRNVGCGAIVFVALHASAAGAQAPKDTCALVDAVDLAAVVGVGAKTTPIGDEQCNIKGAVAGYEIRIRRSNAAREMKDWQEFSMTKPVTKLDIGDEAYAASNGTAVIVRKGDVAIRVSSAGVMPKAPMPYKEGNIELARRITRKLK